MEEIWKDVKGYEGLYQVSDLGNVRSLNFNRKGYVQNLLLQKNNNGYLTVMLTLHGKQKRLSVHRLVAEAFIPNPCDLPCVNHLDESFTNNRASNLEWCTQAYNLEYGTRRAREIASKMKAVEQLKNGAVVKRWTGATEAESAGFSRQCIYYCCNGKQSQHKGYEWRYAM